MTGRPPFKPTQVMRRKVAIAAGGGMSETEIATALGIARGTLRKHFKEELKAGALSKRLEVLDAMHKAAKKGNVSAQRAYLSTVMAMNEPAPAPKAKPAAPKKGKKEQAQEEAASATMGTEWDDLLPPHGAVIQ